MKFEPKEVHHLFVCLRAQELRVTWAAVVQFILSLHIESIL